MSNFLERIKKFLHRAKNQNKILEPYSIVFNEGCDFSNNGEFSKWDNATHPPKSDNTKTVFQTKNQLSFHPSINFEKMARQERLRLANIEKQRSTLGFGLKSRNFKPRPAYERKTWKLDKKPDE